MMGPKSPKRANLSSFFFKRRNLIRTPICEGRMNSHMEAIGQEKDN